MLCGWLPFEDPNVSALYKKILSGSYELPDWVSRSAADLLSNILCTNPEQRYTIEQIRNHPWMQKISYKSKSFIITGMDSIKVNENIIQQVQKLNLWEAEYVRKSVK
jgi:5'-AMP-activated protein kinase catalytic alpha subunit